MVGFSVQGLKSAVVAYVRAEYDALVFQQPTSYVSKNAQSDPDGWRERLCELIASDEKRVRAIMEAAQRKAAETKQGFTLIEMSIVLVIIGLIVGGVLVGQSLISAAGVRATITQVEKFNTAANTFYGKYGYLPGDIPAGPAAQFGFAARGQYPGQGDGNGIIIGNWSNSATGVAPHTQCAGAGANVGGAYPGHAAAASVTSCYDNGGNASATMNYSVEISNGSLVNCALTIRMQAGD